jgi:hypothetical protein
MQPSARQLRLSNDDLKMMVDGVVDALGSRHKDGVDMDAFLRVMQNTSWY